VPADGLLDHPNVLIGSADTVAERLLEQRERYGASYLTVYQSGAENFAPVVARLAGQ
jgi:hypothetical protein